jgi:hypothetical protein
MHQSSHDPSSAGRHSGPVRRSAPVLGLIIVLLGLILPAGAAGAASDATTTLAERYAPIVVVREQAEACGEGEPYRPTPVTTVLGQQGVVLRGPNGEEVSAPSAQDIAGKGEGWYLDYPGNPLAPHCEYEKWFTRTSAGSTPTLYARVATDPAHPDKLALQYWFFYTYNDWNDKHEGDWEMIQVVIPATTPEDALTTTPESVAYAQHEGSQVSPWDSPGLIKQGNHPVVYPGQGSHAAYYLQETWFGKSSSAGFGCDNTTAPGVEVTPTIEVLPPGAPPTSGPFAWLSYTGHWGQEEPSFNNGPTGPVTKTQWATPITWQVEEGRTSAVSLPPVAGPALKGFCSATAKGSLLFIRALNTPILVIGALLALLVLALVLISRTDWRHAQSDDPDRQRRAGQIVTAAFGWVRRHAGAVAGISAVIVAVLALSRLIRSVLLAPRASNDITDIYGTTGRWAASLALLLLAIVLMALAGWVAASVISLIRDHAQGRPLSPATALKAGLRERAGILSMIGLLVAALVMTGSIILIPVAAWLVSCWAVAPAAAVVEGLSLGEAFRRSADLTKGHRWRTLIVQTLLLLIGLGVAGLVGAVILLLTGWPFWVSTGISVLMLAVLLPVAFAGTAMQFYDLRRRASEQGASAGILPTAVR